MACLKGFVDIVGEILMKNFPKMPKSVSLKVVVAACESGDVLLLKLLLSDPRISPKSILKKLATKQFRITSDAMSVLLADTRVIIPRPPIFLLKLSGELQTLELAIKDPRVELDSNLITEMIENATTYGHAGCLSLLIHDARCPEPSKETKIAYFENAIQSNNLQTVETIFQWIETTNPDLFEAETTIERAAALGSVEIFKFLLDQVILSTWVRYYFLIVIGVQTHNKNSLHSVFKRPCSNRKIMPPASENQSI